MTSFSFLIYICRHLHIFVYICCFSSKFIKSFRIFLNQLNLHIFLRIVCFFLSLCTFLPSLSKRILLELQCVFKFCLHYFPPEKFPRSLLQRGETVWAAMCCLLERVTRCMTSSMNSTGMNVTRYEAPGG